MKATLIILIALLLTSCDQPQSLQQPTDTAAPATQQQGGGMLEHMAGAAVAGAAAGSAGAVAHNVVNRAFERRRINRSNKRR